MLIRKDVWHYYLQSPIVYVEQDVNKMKKEGRYLGFFNHNKEEQEYFEKEFEKKKEINI
jgi:hypothetical protein